MKHAATTFDPHSVTIAGIRPPDSRLAREAIDFAREASSPVLFNHVMRSYLLAELLAQAAALTYDREVVLLSAVLHDLGLTDHARGSRRFEIEGADAARTFVTDRGFADDKAWLVWDTIALHTLDLNLHKQAEARAVQWGIAADVVGPGIERLDRSRVDEIVAAYPRLAFKREFLTLLRHEAESKPATHPIHPCTMVAHHCLGGVQVPDARQLIENAPFKE